MAAPRVTQADARDGSRSKIVEAAGQVLAQKGYAATTVDDVIVASGTSRATFYRWFASKSELFDELSRACFTEMREVIRAFGAPVRDRPIEELVAAYVALHGRHSGVIRAWSERSSPPSSEMGAEAARAISTLVQEAGLAIAERRGDQGSAPLVDAALLFVALERPSSYLWSRQSRIAPARLAPTLAAMIDRALFNAPVADGGS